MKTLYLTIIVIVFLVFSGINFVFVQKAAASVKLVFLSPDKELYFPGDFLLIKGHVYMNITKVTVALEKNLKSIVHSMDSPVSKNGTFYANFTIPKDHDAVYWNIVTTAGGGTLNQGLPFKSASFSPFEQLKLGIMPVQVKCDYGLELIIKAEGGSPACVKPQTATILKEWGWTKEWIYINLPGGVATYAGNNTHAASSGNTTITAG